MEKKRVEPTTKQVRDIGAKVEPVYFGVHWERPTVAIFNAIVQDVIAYKTILTANSRLVIVSESPKFLRRVCSSLNVDCMDVKAVKPKIWKTYYEKNESAFVPPDGAETIYSKKVSNEKGRPTVLRPNDPRYPSLFNNQDNRLLPPGKNPNINKIPPRTFTTPMSPTAPILPLW